MRRLLILAVIIGGCYYYFKPDLSWKSVQGYLDQRQGEPWTAQAQYYLGMGQYARGQYPEAIECFQKVLENHPTSYYFPSSAFRLAQCYEEVHEIPKSVELYKKVFDEYPKSPHAGVARKSWERLPRTND